VIFSADGTVVHDRRLLIGLDVRLLCLEYGGSGDRIGLRSRSTQGHDGVRAYAAAVSSEWSIRAAGGLVQLSAEEGDTQADFLADGPFGVRARVEVDIDPGWFEGPESAGKFPPGVFVQSPVRPMGGLTETFHVIASSMWPVLFRVRAALLDDETGERMAESEWIEVPAGPSIPYDDGAVR
jgi:hypothetical protein